MRQFSFTTDESFDEIKLLRIQVRKGAAGKAAFQNSVARHTSQACDRQLIVTDGAAREGGFQYFLKRKTGFEFTQ